MTTRRQVALGFYLILIVGGGWATFEWLVNGGKGIALKLGAFPALFGLYLVWEDFLSPNREKAS
ncbi:hypothetical protein SAMN05216374_3207 [Tardiphaga sp. OK246]|uniref:hypothetical protein n=1 Tax=Tardiphaga sp. OK246 TaxID=1855307 RepID=UPI000B7601ED|nr:hypothetical protein [Tardiphaga sp. OK246]SNT32839.1 hypothetical protein SAMN05216374_3207 [Tardiphaga sp. OK246]